MAKKSKKDINDSLRQLDDKTHIFGAGEVVNQPITDALKLNFMPYAMIFTGGLPEQLTAAIEKKPVLGALIVPLAEMAEARKAINSGTGRLAALFQKAKEV